VSARDPWGWSGPVVGLSFIGGVGASLGLSEHPYPRPGSEAGDIRRYFGQRLVPRVSATGQAVSAAALVAFTASVTRLAGRSGRGSRRCQGLAVAGGAVAAGSLATSALCAAALGGRRGRRDATAVALHRRAFLVGGPAHGAGFGALLGALGLAGLRTGELPRPVAIAALASAAPNLLGPLYLLAEPAGWFIPAGRFPGLVVIGIAGAHLGRRA
jgi:hypothetical protein